VQGLVKIDKKCFVCTLLIKSFVYDPENDSLRINGVNATENKWIGMGASQSMEIRPPRQLLIVKKVFDSMHVRRLDQMIKEADSGHLVAITMEEGIANLFVVSQSKTILKSKIEKSISKNKGVGNKHASSKGKFFDQVISALEKNFTGEQQ
jgi:protein pelota